MRWERGRRSTNVEDRRGMSSRPAFVGGGLGTIVLILVVNVTAAVGALAFGYLQDAIGHVRSMALILLGWIVMIATAYFADDAPTFWVAANLAGLCMGSSQAAGRAIVGYLTPRDREAEFFGLWGLSVKTASIFGPLTYGAVTLAFAER